MTRDWKQIARASEPGIPPADLAGVVRTLEALESAFRPLAQNIPAKIEPAAIFRAAPEDGE